MNKIDILLLANYDTKHNNFTLMLIVESMLVCERPCQSQKLFPKWLHENVTLVYPDLSQFITALF